MQYVEVQLSGARRFINWVGFFALFTFYHFVGRKISPESAPSSPHLFSTSLQFTPSKNNATPLIQPLRRIQIIRNQFSKSYCGTLSHECRHVWCEHTLLEFICIAVMNNWHSNGMVYQDGSFSKIFNSLQFYVKTAQRNNINYENSLILKTSVFQTFNTRVYLHDTKISDQFMLTVMFTKDFWVFLWNSLLQVSDTPDEACS